MTLSKCVKEILEQLGIQGNQFDLYKVAFTHQSYNENHVESNELIEYLGMQFLIF